MRITSVDYLEPGLVLARDVMDDDGRVLLHAGVVLTESYVRALEQRACKYVYVKDPGDAVETAFEEDLDPVLRSRAIISLRETYESISKELGAVRQGACEEVLKACTSGSNQALAAKGSPFARLLDVVSVIIDDVLTRSTLAGLTSIKSGGNRAYNHAIDVCVVGIMIGRAINQPDTRMRQLATGCLLHDIGKTFIDPNQDERAVICQHTRLGYELLRTFGALDVLAPHVAYEHHEHQDGSGLPRGLKGSNKIERDRSIDTPIPSLLGEIAAVANVYDNLVSGSRAEHGMMPDEALQGIRKRAGTRLNREVVEGFLKVVPVFPLGTEVWVVSKDYPRYTAIVTRVNKDALDKPIITVFKDTDGKPITPVEVDLRDAQDVKLRSKTILG